SSERRAIRQANKVNSLYAEEPSASIRLTGHMLPKISAYREEPTPEGALVECSEKLRNFLAGQSQRVGSEVMIRMEGSNAWGSRSGGCIRRACPRLRPKAPRFDGQWTSSGNVANSEQGRDFR